MKVKFHFDWSGWWSILTHAGEKATLTYIFSFGRIRSDRGITFYQFIAGPVRISFGRTNQTAHN